MSENESEENVEDSSTQNGQSDDDSSDNGDVGRQVAVRVLAGEFNDGTYTFRKSDDDRAPVYQLLPTGAEANRIFISGSVSEVEDVGDDEEYLRARVIDPTGTFYVYAGQYQPEAAATLRNIDIPSRITVTGKPRTYETDDGEINVSVRPESISIVDKGTRDRWVYQTAEQTIERIENFTTTNGVVNQAVEQYGDDVSEYKEHAVTALQDLLGESESTEHDEEATTEASTGQ